MGPSIPFSLLPVLSHPFPIALTLASAAIVLPSSSTMISPGTRSRASISLSEPSRTTTHLSAIPAFSCATMSPACLWLQHGPSRLSERSSLLLVPSHYSVHSQNTDDYAEIDPVLKTSREDDRDFHDIQDRAAEIRHELEELVLGRAVISIAVSLETDALAFPARCTLLAFYGSRPRKRRDPFAGLSRAIRPAPSFSGLLVLKKRAAPSWPSGPP